MGQQAKDIEIGAYQRVSNYVENVKRWVKMFCHSSGYLFQKYFCAFLHKKNNKIFDESKKFKTYPKKQTNKPMKILRSVNVGEYFSKDHEVGITTQRMNPYVSFWVAPKVFTPCYRFDSCDVGCMETLAPCCILDRFG